MFRIKLVSLFIFLLLPTSTIAQHEPNTTSPSQTDLPWYSHNLELSDFSWGGEYAGAVGWKNKDRSGFADLEQQSFSDQEIKLRAGFEHFNWLQASATLKAKKTYRSGIRNPEFTHGFESAYFGWASASGGAEISLGRKYYEDRRGFLFHESLDGLHSTIRWLRKEEQWRADFFAGRQAEGSGPVDFRLAQVTMKQKARQLGAYYLSRSSREGPGARRVFMGFRSSGQLLSSLEHWAEFALMGGSRMSEFEAVSRRAWGADVGLLWTPAEGLITTIAAYAYGSGDRDPDDGIDKQFRQTGLQLNNGWVGHGGTKLKYFGELLKPELSNLAISTLGLRWSLPAEITVEILHHRYRQPVASTTLYAYGLSQSPSGAARSLGQEWDLVVSHRLPNGLRVELNLAQFRPGAAFQGRIEPLNLAYIDLRYFF